MPTAHELDHLSMGHDGAGVSAGTCPSWTEGPGARRPCVTDERVELLLPFAALFPLGHEPCGSDLNRSGASQRGGWRRHAKGHAEAHFGCRRTGGRLPPPGAARRTTPSTVTAHNCAPRRVHNYAHGGANSSPRGKSKAERGWSNAQARLQACQ